MDLYIYSDESGVFDYLHNRYFVFSGIICFNRNEKDNLIRKYINIENDIKKNENKNYTDELKATLIKNKSKIRLYKALKNVYKFGVVIDQKQVHKKIFQNKKSKQRYLDYAYKIAVKRCFEELIKNGIINPDEIKNLIFFVDEHTTATNGRYELQEALEQEFKYGTFNYHWNTFYEPIFDNLSDVVVKYRDSKKEALIRAADITANYLYHLSVSGELSEKYKDNCFIITSLP